MKMTAIYPAVFARFYDTIYKQIRHNEDLSFYLEKCLNAGRPVLEIGSGTGRLFIESFKNGADIYGIDISPSMIEVLTSKLRPEDRHRVKVGDIRTLQAPEKYKLIIAPFRVFMHLTGESDPLTALERVYHSLSDGGEFIFDLFIPQKEYLENGIDHMIDFEGEYAPGEKLRRTTSAHYDIPARMDYITMQFEWTEKGKSYSEIWESEMRFYFYEDLKRLLDRSKFASYEIFGSFDMKPVDSGSKDFVIVCKK